MFGSRSVAASSRLGPVWLWGVLWFVAYFVARVLLKDPHPDTLIRVTTALAPMPFAALTVLTIVRDVSGLDELERRIQLEALAFAYLVTMLFLMTVGLMQRAVELNFENWSYLHVWGMLPFFYFAGVFIARKRYS